ncbi:DHH family phosphoesterase [Candidatus Falkowbacteria bacterium]|nr:DHH family phosphoesterase [Candidatus Falkowbacteria bacterium]
MLTIEQQIFEQIKKAKNILITFRKSWNGDSVASALAIFLFLKKLGKNVELVVEKFKGNGDKEISFTPASLSFLPSYAEIKNSMENLRQFIISLDITNTKVSQIKYKVEDNTLNFIISPKDGFFTHDDITSRSGGFKYDLIIVVDTPDLESLGKIYDNDTEFFYHTPIINLDHHPENEEFGQINFTELTAVSTSEILFSLFDSYSREFIDENIATCLLAGMISKTRSFKTPNVTPKALSAAAQLISMGARREEIVNNLYRSRPLNVIKLWGRMLARLSNSLDGKLAWSTLTNLDFIKTNTSETDLNDVIDELIINMPLVKVIVIIYEKIKDGKIATNALVYSGRNLNSLDLAKNFNPTGIKDMAKIQIDKSYAEAEKEIIAAIEEKMKKLPL